MRFLLALVLVTACGAQPVAAGDADGGSPEAQLEVVEPDQEEIPILGGGLRPGYNQRGCQWDNPGCGQPTPGGSTPDVINPVR